MLASDDDMNPVSIYHEDHQMIHRRLIRGPQAHMVFRSVLQNAKPIVVYVGVPSM